MLIKKYDFRNRLILIGFVLIELLLLYIGAPFYLIILVPVFAGICLFNKNEDRIYEKLNYILDEECDPEKYIEEYVAARKLKGKEITNPIDLYFLSLAYLDWGKEEIAKEYFDRIPRTAMEKDQLLKIACYFVVIPSMIQFGEMEGASRLLEEIEQQDIINVKIHSATKRLVQYNRAMILANQGDTQEARERLNQLLENPDSKRSRMMFLYSLARVDETEDKLDDAIEKFETVAREGNKFVLVDESKEKINELMRRREQTGGSGIEKD